MGWEKSAHRGPLTEKHLSWLLLSGITHNMLEMNIGERQGGTLVHLFFPILIIKSNSKKEKKERKQKSKGPSERVSMGLLEDSPCPGVPATTPV